VVDLWPWLTLALLGAFHGLNPAMGWLFAVGLGLQERDRTAVPRALVPIALGHAVSIGVVAAALAAARVALDGRDLRLGVAGVLVAFGGYRLLRGFRHKARGGMRVGFAGLAFWSFLTSAVHGAGLMVLPPLLELQGRVHHAHAGHAPQSGTAEMAGSLGMALAAVGVHTLAMLAVALVVAVAVFDRLGLGVLRRAWVNVDVVWALVLLVSGALTLLL
jgi:hypothetical protein